MELPDYRYLNEVIDRQKKRAAFGIKNEDFVIMSTGELNANKNHEVIIRAIAEPHNPHVKYIIAGKGVREEYLQNLIDELNLHSQVKLLGFRTDIPELLHLSDCFAFPSRREGLGLSAIEAMAAGLPLLTSNIGGINSYSENGVTGYKYDPDDVEGFAEGIRKLMNVNDASVYSFNCHQEARKFDVSVVKKIMREVYKEL